MPRRLAAKPEIIPPGGLSLKQTRAAVREVNRVRRTEGKEASQRAWLRSGLEIVPEMLNILEQDGALRRF